MCSRVDGRLLVDLHKTVMSNTIKNASMNLDRTVHLWHIEVRIYLVSVTMRYRHLILYISKLDDVPRVA